MPRSETVLPELPEHPARSGLAAVPTLEDPRVLAVLAVLRGATIESTAARWSVDHTLLQRWLSSFVTAGAAALTQQRDAQAARQRDHFLAAFDVEVREPLAAVGQLVSLLTDGAGASADVIDVAARLGAELHRLQRRADGAALLLSAAMGGLETRPAPVTVRELCADLDQLGPVRGRGEDLTLEVDPTLMARVLGDLWQAAGHDPAPRTRSLYVRVVGPWVELRVLRSGPPIETGVLQRLFEPFDQGHLASGTSIGLYLARALTVALGGTLGVDQDASGAGFWVRVPAAPARHPRDAHHPHPPRRRRQMMFRLACGDVMPGCGARFESEDHDDLLGQVATHAAQDHGLTEITPEVLAAVKAQITAA